MRYAVLFSPAHLDSVWTVASAAASVLALRHAARRSAQDGDHSYIRLNFNFGPGYEPCVKFPGAICLKELSFRTADTQHAAKVGPVARQQGM